MGHTKPKMGKWARSLTLGMAIRAGGNCQSGTGAREVQQEGLYRRSHGGSEQ